MREVQRQRTGLGNFVLTTAPPCSTLLDPARPLVEDSEMSCAHILGATALLGATLASPALAGSRYADIVREMNNGAGQWEAAAPRINFVYVPSQDASCNTRNKSVVFSVEPVQTSQYIARAFFPSTPKRQRNVLVDDSIWSSGSWTPSNILAHELGHTLGFRHEHTRPESGTCFEDTNWRPLTPYDSASIMHYPQCNGSSDNLSMSATDRQGAALGYP
jgi:hypothetical protein